MFTTVDWANQEVCEVVHVWQQWDYPWLLCENQDFLEIEDTILIILH